MKKYFEAITENILTGVNSRSSGSSLRSSKQGLLLELVDEMVKGTLPEWMRGGGEEETGQDGACFDYSEFFKRTKYTVPEGVLDENGRMDAFNNDLVIRCLDKVVVKDDGYEVAFKAGMTVEIEI